MARAKMAGPFVPVPLEVIRTLAKESRGHLSYYVVMLAECFLETDEDNGTEWCGAYVHDSVRAIIGKLGGSGNLRSRIFPRWKELELVEIRRGSFYILKYYKKGDAYIQPLRMNQEIGKLKTAQGETALKQKELEGTQKEMEGTIQNLLALLSEKGANSASTRREVCLVEARSVPLRGPAVSLLDLDQKKIPLKGRDKLISVFYRGIGQNRISKAERVKCYAILKNLEEDFTPEEIAMAIDWTINPKNTTQKIRSFGILSSTISQAVEAQEKMLQAQEAAEEKVQEETSRETQKLDETAERERHEGVKLDMPEKQRAELRNAALEELREMGVYQESMITDILIGIQENAILRKREDD